MGSDVGVRVPPLNPASARARRSLAASRAARDGISTMVDALRISKPPRAPSNPPSTSSSVPAARRHALIPLAEGRLQLEARIRTLEDAISARDADLLTLKRKWGRALIKRRLLENERESARNEIASLRDNLQVTYSTAQAERNRLSRCVDDVSAPLPELRRVLSNTLADPQIPTTVAEELAAALDDIDEVLSTTRDAIVRHPLPAHIPQILNNSSPTLTHVTSKPHALRGPLSAVGSDDDAKSCPSLASSAAFGDDRETQLDTLVELVSILESKLATGPPHQSANSAIQRAKHTMSSVRPRSVAEVSSLVTEHDRLKVLLDAVMAEKESIGGEDAALALAAKAEAELREAKEETERMRTRLSAVEKLAKRVVTQNNFAARNSAVENELRSAKKTIERLVQERNSLRKISPSAGVLSNTPNSSKIAARGHSDAMRRILDWRKRASSENHETVTDISPLPDGDSGVGDEQLSDTPARFGRAVPLPDRPTNVIQGRDVARKRRMVSSDVDATTTTEAQSPSERSLEPAANDSISAQSLPVRGFLRRHDSFLSAGNISASGDEITITNNRNLFNAGGPPVLDGLRGLLGG